MGSPRDIRESQILAMKILYIVGSFLAAQAVAEAEPEANPNAKANADPWYSYGYGLGHRYGGYGHHGYAAYRPRYGGYGLGYSAYRPAYYGYGGHRGYGYYGKR